MKTSKVRLAGLYRAQVLGFPGFRLLFANFVLPQGQHLPHRRSCVFLFLERFCLGFFDNSSRRFHRDSSDGPDLTTQEEKADLVSGVPYVIWGRFCFCGCGTEVFPKEIPSAEEACLNSVLEAEGFEVVIPFLAWGHPKAWQRVDDSREVVNGSIQQSVQEDDMGVF